LIKNRVRSNEREIERDLMINRWLIRVYRTVDNSNIDKCPCPHNSKHFPLYSPFHSNLNVVAKLIRPGIASILIYKVK